MTDAIRLTRLPSGLTVVSEKMPRVETVSLGAYVDAGARHEMAAENGVSHFLEHMAFKGTATRDAAAIAREIENVGGHINAYTSRENTAFYCKVLKEDAGLAADIIGDILCHSAFAPEEVERERGVILQEIGQANDTPDDIVFDHFQATAYATQAMGRPVLGTEDTIKAMSRDALTGYMKRHYGGSRMVVAAAGAITAEELSRLLPALFEGLPDGAPPEAPPLPPFAAFGQRVVQVPSPQSAVLFGQPGIAVTDPDWEAAQVVLRVLGGGGFSSRLMEAVRVQRGLTYGIGVGLDSLFGQGVIVGSTSTDNARVAETLAVTRAEWARMAADGPTPAELEDAVAFLTGNLPLQFTDSRRIAGTLLALRRNDRPIGWLNERAGRLRALTQARVAEVARRVLKPDALAVAIAGQPEGV